MKKYLISIYDSTLKQFINVDCVDKKERFVRDLKTLVNDPNNKSLVSLYPEQFTAIVVGVFDDESGVITPCNESVCKVITLKEAVKLENISIDKK